MILWMSWPREGRTTPYPMHTIRIMERDSERLAAPKITANTSAPCARAPSRFQSLWTRRGGGLRERREEVSRDPQLYHAEKEGGEGGHVLMQKGH